MLPEVTRHNYSTIMGFSSPNKNNVDYQPITHGRTTTPLTAHGAVSSTTVQRNHVRTLEEIESELLKQRASQPVYDLSDAFSTTTPMFLNSPAPMRQSQSQSLQEYESQNAATNEVEHQLRMMHLNQLQHLQASRQEQQLLQQQLQMEELERQQQKQIQQQIQQQQLQEQQLHEQLRQEQLRRISLRQLEELQQQEQIRQMQQAQQEQKERLIRQVLQQQQQQPSYQSMPHSRQVRTPDRFGVQNQFQKSFPNTPEPQLSPHVSQQHYLAAEQQQNHLQMQRQLLLQLSQAGVAPDQIHLLDAVQREVILNEARRKIQAAEQLDQRNRRRLAKMERMVCEHLAILLCALFKTNCRPDITIS